MKAPNEHHWNKLAHLMKYLQYTAHLPLVLSASRKGTKIYNDGAHAVHSDKNGQSGFLQLKGKDQCLHH